MRLLAATYIPRSPLELFELDAVRGLRRSEMGPERRHGGSPIRSIEGRDRAWLVRPPERRPDPSRAKAAVGGRSEREAAVSEIRVYFPSEADREASLAVRGVRAAAHGAVLATTVRDLKGRGVRSLMGMAQALTVACVPTARGVKLWNAIQVSRSLAVIDGRRPATPAR